MKTILVPTDFSKAAANALDYAAEMAIYIKAKIILMHVYDNTPPALDVPIVPNWEDMVENSLKELKIIENNLEQKYGVNLIVQTVSKTGFTVEEINDFAKENNIDFIVIGMQGAGYLEERIIGSTTTHLMRKSHCPIISVTQGQKFELIKKIAVACDYQELDSDKVLAPVIKLAHLFNAQIYLLHVIPESDDSDKLKERLKVDMALKEIKHTSYAIVEGDIVDNINSFVATHGIDMVVMMPRNHSFVENLFSESNTKRMAFHSKAPLLSLHA